MRSMREAFAAIFRSPARSLVSVLAIMMALVLFGVFGLITGYTQGLIDLLRKGEEISVYLDDSRSNADMIALDAAIHRAPEVEATRVVSKEDAAAEFERMFGENLLSAFEENPLPRSIVVTMAPGHRNAEDFERIGKRLEAMEGVESVEYGREWMVKMDVIFLAILAVEGVLGILVGIAGVIIIANSIGLTVLTRREAIEIMRLVGATERFIRRPFYLEGAILGLAAGILAFTVLYGPYLWAEYSLADFELYLHTFGISRTLLASGVRYLSLLIPAGALLGLFGSRLAIRRAA